VDVIVSGVNVINKMNITSPNQIGDKEVLNGFEDLYEAFVHFFSRGAPAERFMANENAFDRIVAAIEDKDLRAQVKFRSKTRINTIISALHRGERRIDGTKNRFGLSTCNG
jgi:hypothetical protein